MGCKDCNSNSKCSKCCSTSPPRYGGPNIDCLGVETNQTYDQIIESVTSNLCDVIEELNGINSIDHVSFTSSTGGGAAGQPGETDTYTIWQDAGETQSLGTFDVYNGTNGIDGDDGDDGQSIDHVSFTSSTGGGAAGQPGETDTYTVWGDVGETISLGTFDVYNGADGVAPFKFVYEEFSNFDGGVIMIPYDTWSACATLPEGCLGDGVTASLFVDMHINVWFRIADTVPGVPEGPWFREVDVIQSIQVDPLTGNITITLTGGALGCLARVVILG